MNRFPSVILFLALLSAGSSLYSQVSPKREFRAAWIASVSNLDWPKPESRGNSNAQKADLIALLDRLQSSGFNAVFLQIRPECDALYRSPFEPWSYYLTGVQGQAPDPYYDPLTFAIAEAHRRGMELHAWFNPFRAVRSAASYPLASTHITVKHPQWVLSFGRVGMKMLDPGKAEVRRYVAHIVSDVVRRYDVDGVHFDDYFYPYPEKSGARSFPGVGNEDSRTFAAEPRGFADVAQWRRDNVNLFVQMVHDSIQAIRPRVKFGISPFGIWKTGVPSSVSGLGAFEQIYCDAMAWLRGGTVDYLVPQLYWQSGGDQDYAALLAWWSDSVRIYGRHLYSGMAAYKINRPDWTAAELPRQLRINRTNGGVRGEVFFRATSGVSDNPRGFADSLHDEFYRYRALLPPMRWKDSIPPLPPQNLRVARLAQDGHEVQWSYPAPAADGDTATSFVLYRFERRPQAEDFADPRNLLAVTTDTVVLLSSGGGSARPQFYAVRSLDRSQNESENGDVLVLGEPLPVALASPHDGSREERETVVFSWTPAVLAQRYRLQVAREPTFSSGSVLEPPAVADTTLSLALPTPLCRWSPERALPGGLLLDQDSSIILQEPARHVRSRGERSLQPDADSGAHFYWRVRAENAVGPGPWSPASLFLRPQVLETQDPSHLPERPMLRVRKARAGDRRLQFEFRLPQPAWVRIVMANPLRAEEGTVLNCLLPAGTFSFSWDGSAVREGYYTCRMLAGDAVTSGGVMLIGD